jgi:hypothetical protein
MIYKGGCHCGGIAFEVEGELEAAVACNCSICARKGALLWAVPHGQLRLLAGGDEAGRYTFNNDVIAHRFCPTCGIHAYAEDTEAKADRSAYINIRCLDGLDPASVPVIEFDGRSI